MINEKKHAELRMLILIAPPKLARRAAELFDRGQVPFQYQFHGQGTVSGELLETLGLGSIETVSYTHLDVYKRQGRRRSR